MIYSKWTSIFIAILCVMVNISLTGSDDYRSWRALEHLTHGKKLYNGVWLHTGKLQGGKLQFYSQGTKEQLADAYWHFERTIVRAGGYENLKAEAYFFIGLMHYLAEGVTRNVETAKICFEKSVAICAQNLKSCFYEPSYNNCVDFIARAYLIEIAWNYKDYVLAILQLEALRRQGHTILDDNLYRNRDKDYVRYALQKIEPYLDLASNCLQNYDVKCI